MGFIISGAEVFAIQHLLNHHGAILTVDGDFGPQSRNAVMNFQTLQGLSADGIIGPQTWAELIKVGLVHKG